jgi:hypothetical protein
VDLREQAGSVTSVKTRPAEDHWRHDDAANAAGCKAQMNGNRCLKLASPIAVI